MPLISELRRRNVFRVAAAYAVVGWLLVEVASVVLPTFDAPSWVMKVFTFLVILGFPLALVFAWAFELTPEGIKREKDVQPGESITKQTGRKLDFAIIGLLVLAVVYFAVDKFVLGDVRSAPDSAADPVRSSESRVQQKSVAVLPFIDLSPGGDYAWFSDGLSEEILNSLANLPELMVSARTSSFRFKDEERSISEVAQLLGVANVVEGSVRHSGDRIRVTAQLIRGEDGFHLWSEAYDRRAEDVFAVQEDIAARIAAALDVVLDEAKRNHMFRTGTRDVEAFEAYQRGRAVYDAAHDLQTEEDLFDANRWFEQAIALDPAYSSAYLMHADAYVHFLLHEKEWDLAPRSRAPDLGDKEALARLRVDLESAYRSARDPDLKLAMDYNRTIMSDSWHRLPELVRGLEELYRRGRLVPDENLWLEFRNQVGDAQVFLAEARDRVRASPFNTLYWMYVVHALMGLGQYQEAVEELSQARGRVGEHPLLTFDDAVARALGGDVDAAIEILSTGFDEASTLGITGLALADALSGRRAEARLRARQIEDEGLQNPGLLWVYHELGDEAEVAGLAQEIDARPLGPQRLLLSMYGRRGFFRVADTPNLRARLAEAGLEESDFALMPRFGATHDADRQ